MRKIPSYKWEDMLKEYSSRTFMTLDMIKKEQEEKKRNMPEPKKPRGKR